MRPTLLGLLFLVSGSAANVAQDEPPRWMFVPDLGKVVHFRQPDYEVFRGRLAITGVFIPDRYNPMVIRPPRADHWLVAVNDPNRNPRLQPHEQTEEVYEYRSGSLVRGMLRCPGVFIPIPGERVIWVDDYEPGEKAPRIYNLPGAIVRVPPGKTRKRFPGIPDDVSGADWTRDGLVRPTPKPTHTYRKDLGRVIGLFREKTVYAGRMTSSGDFVPLPDIRPVPYLHQPTAVVRLADGKETTIPILNHPAVEYELVYECRDFVLLRGRLAPDGRFMALDTAPTVRWAEYFDDRLHAKPDSRIYNLPGSIVPIGKE